ncbi:tetratricopeptide repeat protein [Simkania negevensis]|uniref:Outer membrane lipoprotein BamD-like domain-containing protein n=1 Tax=Simkania negevensis (strain ATCC VR-1471 / DSM 27360 / Z) TaxID=331113 RepID=F8L406_SIMNZ|nr:outer membrane protein assembly factor BamD [Simkania negevensis]MCB1066863.1 outer membrane protein assembly factor BamD [Simkania sp.]MCB1075770.1 outer membrane protein assembly factor BamD [Simkania sp.]MCP5489746.1 outer membrane protein assembly factor BamD [Chlamydiales bacterium]CCB90036.1 putative uncharacterized protein [Simkania negevensis Z]
MFIIMRYNATLEFGMKQLKKIFVFFILTCGVGATLHANPLDPTSKSEISVHDHYNLIIDFFQNKEWEKLIWQSRMLMQDFPDAPFAKEVYYYMGVAYYEITDYEMANESFSAYLKEEMTPKFFDQVIRYKFEIACHFQEGVRRHLFHVRGLPKWIHGYEEAIEIFDEVITTLPRDEMAAESLYRKATLLLALEEYKESVEAYQTLIRRFPKHPLAPDSYLGVAEVYLTWCQKEFPDGDRLELAEINLRKFRFHFPREPRLEEAEKKLLHLKDVMADDLLEMGEFYHRTKRPKAAAIYYQTILKKYPDTKAAKVSRKKLEKLGLPETFSEMENASDKVPKKADEAIIVESDEEVSAAP